MKRLQALCLALLLVSLLLPTPATAAGTLSISHVSGKAGETATVEVRLESEDVCGGGFNLNYNAEELELVSADKASGWMGFVNPKPAEHTVRVSLASTEVIEDQLLLTMTFRVLEDTSAEGSAITVSHALFYDENGEMTAAKVTDGSVAKDCAWLRLDDAKTVEGQAARVEVSLGGKLLPAGGEFTICYDSTVVRPTAVLSLEGAEDTLLSYNLAVSGEVKIAFAGTKGVENGRFCAVIFEAVGEAESNTELTLTEIRLRDENEKLLDHAVAVGSVSIQMPGEADPKLWVVGGAIEENGGATVSVVLQGSRRVSGGQFSLSFDAAMQAEIKGGTDVTCSEENGTVKLAWAGVEPEADKRTLLTIHFAAPKEGSAIRFGSDVRLYDSNDKQIGVVDIRPAEITAVSRVTAMVDEIKVESKGEVTEVTAVVDFADASFYTETPTERVVPMMAVYENGRMTGIVRADSLALSEGTAEAALSVNAKGGFDDCQVFLVSDDAAVQPLCAALQVNLS